MDFGKILDQWEKYAGPVYDKDAEFSGRSSSGRQASESPAVRRKRLLGKKPEATIDLHGLTRDEAWDALTAFFNESKNRGLEKVMVIHGKGNHAHSGEEAPYETAEKGILKKMARDFIERCPFAGEHGHGGASSGGSGATWVLLKSSVPGR